MPDENPEKIIYSADATVETTEFDKTLEELAALIKEYGGWVQSSSINGANYYSISRGSSYNRSADYTIRIPSDKFQTVRGSLSTLRKRTSAHSIMTCSHGSPRTRLRRPACSK